MFSSTATTWGRLIFLTCFLLNVCRGSFYFPPATHRRYMRLLLPFRNPRAYRSQYRYEPKRGPGLDRIAMGFIKRDDPSETSLSFSSFEADPSILDSSVWDSTSKRQMDSIAGGLLRKKRSSSEEPAVHDALVKEGKRQLDKTGMSLVQKETDDPHAVDRRRIGRLSMGLVKKENSGAPDDAEEKGWNFGEMHQPNDLGIAAEKRYMSRLSMGLVRRGGTDDDDIRYMEPFEKNEFDNFPKRYIGRLNSGLVKKGDEVVDPEKRYIGRVAMGLVKKSEQTKRLDKLSMGFIKKSDERQHAESQYPPHGQEHSEPDAIDKTETGADKRVMDRLGMGFIKKDDAKVTGEFGKRRLDRLNMGLVKKESETEKRRLDRLGMGFVKKDDADGGLDKRRMDRLGFGLVKRTDGLANTQPGGIESGLDQLMQSHVMRTKRSPRGYFGGRLDRIGYGFIKRDYPVDSYGTPYHYHPQDTIEKRVLDRLGSGFVRRALDRINFGLV